MRILKVCQTYYPYLAKGGQPTKVRGIARALGLLGHGVTVLTAYLGPLTGERRLQAVKPDQWGWRTESGGIETVYLRTRLRYRTLTLNPNVTSFCRNRLREFDIVHVYGLYDLLGPAVAWYCRRWKVPYVVEPLGMTRPIDRSFWLKGVWKKFLGRDYLRSAATLIATSRQEREELVGEGFPSEKILVRYNGVDGEEFSKLPARGGFRKSAGIPDDQPMILFLGRLVPRKGADFLIDALPQIADGKARLVLQVRRVRTDTWSFSRRGPARSKLNTVCFLPDHSTRNRRKRRWSTRMFSSWPPAMRISVIRRRKRLLAALRWWSPTVAALPSSSTGVPASLPATTREPWHKP